MYSNNQNKGDLINKNITIHIYSPKLNLKTHKSSLFQLINIPSNIEDERLSNLINSKKVENKEKKLHKFLSYRNSLNKLSNKIVFNTQTPKSNKIKSKVLNLKTIFNSPKKPKLTLRKINLELENTFHKKNNKKLNNLKTFNNRSHKYLKINYEIKKKKDEEINTDEEEIKFTNESFKIKTNKGLIKKSFSQNNFKTIYRNIYYYNQKNDLISQKKIVNLILNEKNSLNDFINKHKDKETKFSLVKSISNKLNNKQLIKRSRNLKNINKTKSQNSLYKKDNLKIGKSIRDKAKNIFNNNIMLKTNYNLENEKLEKEKNVDDYIVQKYYNYNDIKILKKFNQNENDLDLGNNKKLGRINNIFDFNNNNFPKDINFIERTFNSLESKNNEKENDIENEAIKSIRKKLSVPKFIVNRNIELNNILIKKRKSIIEGYLSNFNIKSEKYFDKILSNKNKQQQNSIPKNINDSNDYILEPQNRANNFFHFNKHNDLITNKKGSIYKKKNSENLVKGNDYSQIKEINNYINSDELENQGKKPIIMNQKLEKNTADMNIIFEENEQEINNIDDEKDNSYFIKNNKNMNNFNYSKNGDIFKYLGLPINNEQLNLENNNNINIKNKYNDINTNKIISKIYFNANKIEDQSKNNIDLKENNNNTNKRNDTKFSSKNINPKPSSPKSNKNIEKDEKNIKNNEDKIYNKSLDKNNQKEEIKKNKFSDDNMSLKDLSFLEKNNLTQKEKMNILKKYKDKIILNLFSFISKILEERDDLELTMEILAKFLSIEEYKRYIKILKQLIEKERANIENSDYEKVSDKEIIEYLYHIFSDESSKYYIKPKEKFSMNNYEILTSNLSKFSKKRSSNVLTYNQFFSMNSKNETNNQASKNSPIKNYEKELKPKKTKKKVVGKRKTLKEFLNEGFEDEEKQKKDFLTQKIRLTNELKYQIEITQNQEGKGRFKILLDQIETLKNDDIQEYIKFIHDKYENYKKEIKKLVNVRDKEERINYFIQELINDRENINKMKEMSGNNISFEDNKF